MEEAAIGKVVEMFVSTENDLQMADFLNHYQILTNLGAGGMGEVYLAEDTKLNRFVALKLGIIIGAIAFLIFRTINKSATLFGAVLGLIVGLPVFIIGLHYGQTASVNSFVGG